MAKAATSPRERLRRLDAARSDFIATLAGDQLLGAKPMAQLLRVSWNTLKEWVDANPDLERSGAVVRGGLGIGYEFRPLATMDGLVAWFTGECERIEARNREDQKLVAGAAAQAVPAEFDLDRMAKLLSTSTRFQETLERQAELVRAAEVKSVLREGFSAIQQAGVMAAQEADPTGQWSPETRDIVEGVIRAMLLRQQRAAQETLEKLRGRHSQPGEAGP